MCISPTFTLASLTVEIIIGAIAIAFTCAEVIAGFVALFSFKSIDKEP